MPSCLFALDSPIQGGCSPRLDTEVVMQGRAIATIGGAVWPHLKQDKRRPFMDNEYNGWKNWATWNVALWLGNEKEGA